MSETEIQIAESLKQGLCPFCGHGPFVVPATHVVKVHEILATDLRQMAGLTFRDSICDPEHSQYRRTVMEEYRADGKMPGAGFPHWWPKPKAFDEWDHGSPSTYVNRKCRCEACTAAHTAEVALHRKRRAGQSSRTPHGTAGGYVNWCCRCDACRAAHSEAKRLRRAKKRVPMSPDPETAV